ncbi:MAG: hypothetical protein ACOYJR_02020 [Acutalibacteraceae bacterium]|jgi:hypothetical protein
MKTFKVLFLCVLLFLLACCTSAPPSSSEIQYSSFPASSNGVSSAEPIASSEPPAESRDVSQMSAEEYYSVCREYDITLLHHDSPVLPEESPFTCEILYRSFVYGKCIDQNTIIDAAQFHCDALLQDTQPRENYFYWSIQDFPHYWVTNPQTSEYAHFKALYPIIPEPMTCFMLQNDLIWYGSENCELKSAGIDGSHIQAAYTFDTPIKQFCDFDNAMLFLKTGNAIYRFFIPEKKAEKIADVSPSQYVIFQQISNQELAWIEVDSSWYLDENGIPAFDNATPEERGVMYDGKICRGSYINWSTGKTVSGLEMPYKFAFLQHGSGDNPQNYWYDAFRPGSGCTEADLIQWLVDYKE